MRSKRFLTNIHEFTYDIVKGSLYPEKRSNSSPTGPPPPPTELSPNRRGKLGDTGAPPHPLRTRLRCHIKLIFLTIKLMTCSIVKNMLNFESELPTKPKVCSSLNARQAKRIFVMGIFAHSEDMQLGGIDILYTLKSSKISPHTVFCSE